MKIEEFLGSSHITLKKEEIARLIGISSSRFRELKTLALSGKMPICWRSAWMMDYMSEQDPSLPADHLHELWGEMGKPHPDGVKRSILRMLCRYEIPEEYQGMATDLSLDWIQKETVPVALKAYSMNILLKVATLYPELAPEFIVIIENQLPYGSGGYIARAQMVVSELNKLQRPTY